MIYRDLEKLVFSLSASEKKQFLLYANQLKKQKYYFRLYDLILEHRDTGSSDWQQLFKKIHPSVSLESTANYLYKVLTDVLVQIRIEQHAWYQQLHGMMKAQLCFERSLPDRGLREIQGVYKKAVKSENLPNTYASLRMELDALQSINFQEVGEQELINKQMEARMTLRAMNEVQEHYSLYELLNIRLANNPKIGKSTDDLILSELNLAFSKSRNRFETRKVHLLFQSFYFIHKSEYQSAFLIFKDLSNLFEKNEALWNNPPYDYLSTLDGILNSLRSLFQFEEMQDYIDRIRSFVAANYTEHFNNLAKVTGWVYQLNSWLGLGQLPAALAMLQDFDKTMLQQLGDMEKKMEGYYFQALTYYFAKDYLKSKQLLNELFANCHTGFNFIVYRAARLLYIVTLYELHDEAFVDSEIRAYKRYFQKQGKRYQVERLLFKLIASNPKRRGNEWKRKNLPLFEKQFMEILANKSEVSLIKFFDHRSYILNMLRS